MFSSAICEISHNSFSIEHLQTATSLEILLNATLLPNVKLLISCVCKVKKHAQPIYYTLSNVLLMKQ